MMFASAHLVLLFLLIVLCFSSSLFCFFFSSLYSGFSSLFVLKVRMSPLFIKGYLTT